MKPYFFLIIVLWHSSNFAQSKTILDLAFEKGIDYYNKGQYEQAAIQFEKCVQLSKKEKNIKFVGKAYNNLGNVNSQIGKSEESLRYYLLSMDISKQLHDTLTIAKTSKNIGALYEEQKDFNTAMQYYEKALALAKSKQDKPLIADCYNIWAWFMNSKCNIPRRLKCTVNHFLFMKHNKIRKEFLWH